ncbi:5-methyltetrahydropteroyltriglutamate--homocysteine S-methyltransferase [Salinisphaera sp. LB1]|uniref:5-methyltetrahydropteroyltriglutamate-- homocysteine S-methyltransferase n=1 Tax=Salinisphaera sp. LB1 TaxID=2183911 RepID=UPI000D70666A|nr:5-methyltetrahydropteroyltriglutamate--homocysteine S-methyltransferase [Salinisphaera sp. LB1]AWN15294.1 Methionine synthase II (cobalamin-independent) [Salinisphaera sp. LB1]
MRHINPPFRAEHVGSLLRPQAVLEARQRLANGEIDAAALREVEDRAIADAVRKQESVGLQDVTDGEFRRAYFHLDFLKQLDGVSVTGGIAANKSAKASADGFTPPQLSVTGKLSHARPIQVADYEFLASQARAIPKVSIPSPTMVHFRGGRAAIDIEAYPEMDAFFDDLAACYRDEIDALYRAGCRHIQLDDTNLAYLCDPDMRAAAKERGEDPNTLPKQYAELINAALTGRPDDLTVGIHLCRGNYRSTWFAQGGYEPVAEVLFNELAVDAYFLEYDDERSGDFAPLRHVPDNKTVVLGLVSSKTPELESMDALAKRIDEAAAYVDLNQLCLSPQCGFSSTVEGNALTEDDQWAKLERVVETARKVWA